MISRFRIKKFFYDIEEKVYTRLFKISMRQAFPWYDYSFLYKMMHMWLENAYPIYDSEGSLEDNMKVADEMKRASELCKIIADDDFSSFSEKEVPLKELTDILRDSSFGWWD